MIPSGGGECSFKQESDREHFLVKTSTLGVTARARSNPPNTAELRAILLIDFCETAYPDLDPDLTTRELRPLGANLASKFCAVGLRTSCVS